MGALEAEEARCAAVATAPRVSLGDIEAAVDKRYDFVAGDVLEGTGKFPMDDALYQLSMCILVLRNGWMVIGKSAPASAKNFDAALGRELAYQDAIRQIWPLMGFALKERLAATATA